MPIEPEVLKDTALQDVPIRFSEKDAMLYAIGVGLGGDPLDLQELQFVSEHNVLVVMPTFASMLVPDSIIAESGGDLTRLLHRSQSLEFYRSLPSAGKILANQRVVAVGDRGVERGAVIDIETEFRRESDDTVICIAGSRVIARADGGFGGPLATAGPRHLIPKREPDLYCDLETRRNQALLFRLSGDFNPLHSDPTFASAVGFDRPILHGRCTYGMACHAILKTVCNYDVTLIKGFEARFTAPVIPGDVITTEMWQDGNVVSFRCKVAARSAIVINDGRCTLAD